MDHVLQKVVGARRMSLLDGFSRYNQILVHPEDQDKTTFTNPSGTFKYAKMPFGLMNAEAKFQRAMDIAFAEERDKFLVIYFDDITIYSQSRGKFVALKRNFGKVQEAWHLIKSQKVFVWPRGRKIVGPYYIKRWHKNRS